MRSAEQGRVDFVARVFGRSSDEYDVSDFYERQKHILLGFVESVDLVNKNNCCFIVHQTTISPLLSELANLFGAGRDRMNIYELRFYLARERTSKSCFTSSGRAP